MDFLSKIQKIVEASKIVIRDVSLSNGAIVAANSDMPYYPRQASDYHYVWPRDASYICVAAQKIGITTIQEPFFHWLEERPEDFKKESKLYQNYSPNGKMFGHQFQPDQMGSTLWAIHEFLAREQNSNKTYSYEALIRRLADGLCSDWHERYFFTNTVDCWEEAHRKTSTKMQNNFTYTLAATSRGLELANAMIPNETWKKTADQMKQRLLEAYIPEHGAFVRNHGLLNDVNMDASLLGILYPFAILPSSDERMLHTIKKMEQSIVMNGGVHRYQFDYYDGEGTAQEGAGAWPLLNFWLAIVYEEIGEHEKAMQTFSWVINRIENDFFIPEQIFDDFRRGIKPLAWSHAMFIFAASKLGFLQTS